MVLYDEIGITYNRTRRSDPRIVKKLLEILSLPPASTIADIGAGSGSYAITLAECGYRILAIEPSAIMRNQALFHPAIEWIEGYAESLPLPDCAADAAIVILAVHHFQDCQQALQEAHRVVGKGKIVLFTYDPAAISRFWLTEYFPSFREDVSSSFWELPKLIESLQSLRQTEVKVIPFPLPRDLLDSFAAVGWAKPELYLNPDIRSGISSFVKLDTDECDRGLFLLRRDLENGEWERKYGNLRRQQEYDAGYRFIFTI